MTNWQVGDTAIIYRGWTDVVGEGKVVAVGRVWVTVFERGSNTKFSIETGHHINKNDTTRIVSVESYERYLRDKAIRERLRAAGVRISTEGRSNRPLTDDQLERIAAIAEEE